MHVKFKFEKFQGFWCYLGSKFTISHWLCTWALPQCSHGTAPPVTKWVPVPKSLETTGLSTSLTAFICYAKNLTVSALVLIVWPGWSVQKVKQITQLLLKKGWRICANAAVWLTLKPRTHEKQYCTTLLHYIVVQQKLHNTRDKLLFNKNGGFYRWEGCCGHHSLAFMHAQAKAQMTQISQGASRIMHM